MDKIQFERIIVRNTQACICANILINGVSLLETISAYEKAHISDDRDYTPSYQHNYSTELLNQLERLSLRKKWICLLVCTCMEEGCNSFYANVRQTKRHVIMDGFGNPRFDKVTQYNDIDYTKLGKYTFDKQEFSSELEKLRHFSPHGEYHVDWNASE